MYDLIVFDLDGTLADSRAAIVATFQQAARQHALPPPPPEAVTALIGLSLEIMFPRLYPDYPHPERLVAAYRSGYRANDAVHTRVFDGALQTLDRIRATHHRTAIATSKRQDGAQHTVGRLGLREHVDLIAGDVPERPGKPHPAMLQYVLSTLNVAPERAVMVGDTTFDLEMARAAGVDAIGVAWGAHGPERLSPLAPVVHTWAALEKRMLLG